MKMSVTSTASIKPKANVTSERYKLYKLHQKSWQRIGDFLLEVANQVDKCEFRSMRDEIILYKIVGGIDNDEIRNALLADPDLTYNKAVQICRASSATGMYSISRKENFSKVATAKQGEVLGKTPEVSHKELRRSLVESTKKDQEVDSEITGERPFACSICQIGFLHSDTLKRHMIMHMTLEEKEERLIRTTCDVCGKVFSSKAALKTHSLRHTGEKPFACDICGFRTVTSGALSSHLMVHSEEKPFACTVCVYSCKHKYKLQQHMLTHSNEKPYGCEVCGRRFSQSSHVKRHMLVHTGEKPHVCEICGHRWTTRENLKAHMKVHEKQSGNASEYTPPRKRQKEPLIIVVAAESDESEHAAADAIITWSEQVSAIKSEYGYLEFEDPTSFPSDISGSPGEPEASRLQVLAGSESPPGSESTLIQSISRSTITQCRSS